MSSVMRLLSSSRSVGLVRAMQLLQPGISGRCVSTTTSRNGKYITLDVQKDVAVIRLNSKEAKLNTLNEAVLGEFVEIFNKVQINTEINSAVLISGKPGSFIAGPDIEMVQRAGTEEAKAEVAANVQRIFKNIEKSPKPFVAAIHGMALGGGLELTLACHYRIATNDKRTNLGLPEVKLGLVPGAGGTQRLPNLIGIRAALDMALTGKNIAAKKAKRMNLVDRLVETLGPGLADPDTNTMQFLEKVAIEAARGLANGSLRMPERKLGFQARVLDFFLGYPKIRNYFIENIVKGDVKAKTKGLFPAPLIIADVIREGIENDLEAGYKKESESFGKLSQTNESKALIGLYAGQTYCKRNRYGKPQRRVENLVVLGAGLMGAGIAQVSMDKGFNTTLKDSFASGLAKGKEQIYEGFNLAAEKKKITTFERDQIMSKLGSTLSYNTSMSHADIVIEAVFEDIKTKHAVIEETEQVIPRHCIVASNTSALPISEIAKASMMPEKVIGMHYFSPVDKMQLLEIITTDLTSKDTIATAVDVGLRQGKMVIIVKDGPGFYTTRILAPALSEIIRLMQEGHDAEKIDELSLKFGYPVGVATLLDEVGIDIASHVAEFLGTALGERVAGGDINVMKDMVSAGFCGRKTGKGLYIYSGNTKSKPLNSNALKIIDQYSLKPDPSVSSDQDIIMRFVTRFTNEAVHCLQDGIIESPLEGDIGAVFGLGFPPNLGGPFRYIDIHGAKTLVDDLYRFEQVYGASFTPCDLLIKHANDPSKKFHSS